MPVVHLLAAVLANSRQVLAPEGVPYDPSVLGLLAVPEANTMKGSTGRSMQLGSIRRSYDDTVNWRGRLAAENSKLKRDGTTAAHIAHNATLSVCFQCGKTAHYRRWSQPYSPMGFGLKSREVGACREHLKTPIPELPR